MVVTRRTYRNIIYSIYRPKQGKRNKEIRIANIKRIILLCTLLYCEDKKRRFSVRTEVSQISNLKGQINLIIKAKFAFILRANKTHKEASAGIGVLS